MSKSSTFVDRVPKLTVARSIVSVRATVRQTLGHWCCTCWVALTLFVASPAQALTVALLEPVSPSPALKETLFRLQGELLAVGLDVAVAPRPGERPSPAWLDQFAQEREVDAIIDVVGRDTPTGVDIWVLGPKRHASEVPRVVLEPGTSDPGATLAIRAIEVLRSRFVEFDLAMREQQRLASERAAAGAAAAERAPESPAEERSTPAPRAEFGLGLGAVVVTGMDRVGPALLPMASVEWALAPPVAVQATLAGLGTRPSVQAAEGDVLIAQQYGMLGVTCCLSHRAKLEPFVAGSVGALRTSLEGRGAAPYQGHDPTSWSFLVQGSFGLRLKVSQSYYVTLASHVHVAEPYVAIRVVDDLVATTGRPNVLLSLTVGAWL